LKFPKKWCPFKNREKSIRGFCPQRLWGVRQSLTKPWVQGNVWKNPLSAPSNWRIVPSPVPQWSQHLCQQPLQRPFISDKCPLKGHFILKCFLKKSKTEAGNLLLFFYTLMVKIAICFYIQYKWFTHVFYNLWVDFYPTNDDYSKEMLVHRTSTFIFFMFTTGSYDLEKDVMKKEMKNYRKADTELKIAIKKVAIQSSDGSIRPYEDE